MSDVVERGREQEAAGQAWSRLPSLILQAQGEGLALDICYLQFHFYLTLFLKCSQEG